MARQATMLLLIAALAMAAQERVRFSDSRELRLSYTGKPEAQRMLASNTAQPAALATADFDEDGVPDLACGYRIRNGGLVTVQRGNVDAIYPNAPEAQRRKASGEFTDEPFLSPGRIFELPEPPEFLFAGDFDADGHWDMVAGALGSAKLYFLRGDGHGNFAAPEAISLPGAITAITGGEVNRPDGLTDVVVAVRAESGPRLLVFQGPEGALRTKPGTLALPAEATELALGRIYADTTIDLAAGLGTSLILMRGRDGSHETLFVPFEIAGLATGNFEGGAQERLVLLAPDGSLYTLDDLATATQPRRMAKAPAGSKLISAKVSTAAGQDLIVLDRAHRQLHFTTSARDVISHETDDEPVAVLPMRLNSSARQSLVVLRSGHTAPAVTLATTGKVYTVTNTSFDPLAAGSLGAAINAANANPGEDTIVFNIPGNGPFQIQYCDGGATCGSQSFPPRITESLIIDATTQPGYKGTPIVQIVGQPGHNASVIGFYSVNASSVTIRGFALTGVSYGVYIVGGGNHVVEGNYIGTDLSGNIATGVYGDGGAAGVWMDRTPNSLIGGTTAAARNVISGNLQGTYSTTSVTVQGNYIGTNAAGTAAVGNSNWGVFLGGNSIIGGTAAGAGNVISANGTMRLSSGPTGGIRLTFGTLLQGNYIGTNAAGTAALGNQGTGVVGDAGALATIGGTTPAARNVISGNTGHGFVENGSPGRVLQGNYIGTAADGVSPLGNGGNGLVVACCATVGGTTAGSGNVIAFNAAAGVLTDLNRDAIRRNSIFSNGTLGIDNGNYQNRGDGVTKANRNCAGSNFPVLTSAVLGGTTAIAGTVNNDNNASVDIDLFGNASCDISGYGQGHTYLGSTTVTTDSSCNASFSVTLPMANWGERFITATATNITGPNLVSSSTSEFSQCILANVPSMQSNVGGTQAGNPGDSLPAGVRLLDPAGNPIAGITVTFSVTQGPATLSAATAITDLNGIATTQVKLAANPGTVVVSASANGLPVVGIVYSVVTGAVPRINSGGVTGAGLNVPAKTTVAPNGIASVFGVNFAPAGTTTQAGPGDLVNGNVPTNLTGVCVEVGRVRAPVLAVYPAQVDFQVPAVFGTALAVQVITGCGTPGELRSNAATITVQPTAPEFFFFVVNPDGHNPIEAVDSITGAYIGAAGLLTGATTAPAKVNEAVSLYGTSFGGTDPPILPGVFPNGIAPVTAPVTVTLGGVTVPPEDILYVGATQGSPGLFQLDMIVPPGTPDGDLSVVLTIGGVASPPGAYLTVTSEQ